MKRTLQKIKTKLQKTGAHMKKSVRGAVDRSLRSMTEVGPAVLGGYISHPLPGHPLYKGPPPKVGQYKTLQDPQ